MMTTCDIWKRLPALAIAVMAMMASGCLFEAREAEPPGVGGDQTIFDDPQDVFTGMKTGLENDQFSEYERAIDDSEFLFSPLLEDSLDQNFDVTTFADWTEDVEREVVQLLLSEADTLEVDFDATRIIDTNTFVRFETGYSLRVVLKTGGDPVTYRGTAYIDVRRLGGVWQVVFWDEVQADEQSPSWGFLRGIYRQRLSGT